MQKNMNSALEIPGCQHYIMCMVREKGSNMSKRSKRGLAEKARIHELLFQHSNPNIRIAADFLADALFQARKGDVHEFLTALSLAQMFAEKVNFNNPSENLR